MFLVHGGAGTVLLFEPLARRLGHDQPVFAFQAAGLYGHGPAQRSVADMAARYIREMRSVQRSGPYRLGGYCFGALVALEMARQLAARGERTELLVTFNGPSPSYIRRYRPAFDADGARADSTHAPSDGPASNRERVVNLWRSRTSLHDFLRRTAHGGYGVARNRALRMRYFAVLHGSVVAIAPYGVHARVRGLPMAVRIRPGAL